jgi:hypothetical protein
MTTQSTVIVAPLSASHIVMVAMLALHSPLAKSEMADEFWPRPSFQASKFQTSGSCR